MIAVVLASLAGCSSDGGGGGPDANASEASEFTERAADPTAPGPFEVTEAEYKFAAGVDADVLGDRATELWAAVYRPKALAEGERHPLVVFLHGNHGTCGRGTNPRVDDSVEYTDFGTCPEGFTVTPNHLGYAYAAERLASLGYVVVSINANRGITGGGGVDGDFGLNLARGRLVLKHLQRLSEWNATPGATPPELGVDLAGKLDFDQVGLMGHSRGGEGVRAAYVQYNEPGSPWPARIASPLRVRGIIEIGPVDGQTDRVLDAPGTAWNVILPMCDGDVSNLAGMRPFDRMTAGATETAPAPKGMFAVWGANHNFFNTEWQTSDSDGCVGADHVPLFEASGAIGSERQRAAGLFALTGFFRAHVGAQAAPALNNLFDPQFGLPEGLEAVTHVGRAYADAATSDRVLELENFTGESGTSLAGLPMAARGVTVRHGRVPEHASALRAARVEWGAGAPEASLQIPWAAPGGGVDASAMKTLDLRVALQDQEATTAPPVDVSIQLVNADDTVSTAVPLRDYVELLPAGHAVLETARVPLGDLAGADLARVRAVKLTFGTAAPGALFVASVRFSRADAPPPVATPAGQPPSGPATPTGGGTVVVAEGNAVTALRAGPADAVEVEVASAAGFPVADELPRLRVGGRDVVVSRFGGRGDTRTMVFTMSPEAFATAPDGAALEVRYGDEAPRYRYDFGPLRKGALRR